MERSTMAVALGRGTARPGEPVNVPLVLSSTYRAGGPVGYAREDNAVWSAFEEVVGALEGGHAVVFPSGLAAVRALLELLPVDARVVMPSGAYSGTRRLVADLMARGRLSPSSSFVDVRDTDGVLRDASGAALLFVESPTNPMMDVADVGALCAGARDMDVMCAVDNTFATPLVQRPLELGADVVVHSATKLLSGHSDVVLGVLVARSPDTAAELRRLREEHGAVPGPVEAFLALRGLRTLAVRVERASSTAAVLAARCAEHPYVERVRYPGFGSMLSLVVRGDAVAADRVCERVRLITPATSLGGVETLIERRAKYAGDAEAGVPPSLLRVSVGLEDVEDLWGDLRDALDEAAPAR